MKPCDSSFEPYLLYYLSKRKALDSHKIKFLVCLTGFGTLTILWDIESLQGLQSYVNKIGWVQEL